MKLRKTAGLMLIVMAAALAGCGGSKATVQAHTTTVGQELQDLDDARNKGLLTEDEYQRKRRDIINRD
jgi:ABC-type glycerol-3-phosphate transport system substrate-binding protein